MRTLRILSFSLLVFWLLYGCSTHYYRTDEKGVTMHLRGPKTASVYLYTSIDGYLPNAAAHVGGSWINRIPSNREFIYFYKVDGKLMIPDCRFKEKDDFGSENCIYMPGL
jgi:hypothetical protein